MRNFTYPIFDADNHFYEPADAFYRYLPKEYKNDFQYVQVNGRTKLAVCGVISDYIPNPTFDVVAAPGRHIDWYGAKNKEGKSMRELTGEPIACLDAYRHKKDRTAMLKSQGIASTLMFPTLASVVEERMNHDHFLMNAVIHSVNQWTLDEWGFGQDGIFYGVPFITLMHVDCAIRELEWCLQNGARTIGVRPAPVPGYQGSRSFGLKEFDPFWARVAEAGIFVCMHSSDSGYSKYVEAWEGGREFRAFEPTPFKSIIGLMERAISDAVTALIAHGTFDRHPTLKVMSVENGARWVAPLFDRFKYAYGQMPQSFSRDPIETFMEHIYVVPFYEDNTPALAQLIGEDRVVFGSDYPHPEGLENPLDFVDELTGMSDQQIEKFMNTNLRKLMRA